MAKRVLIYTNHFYPENFKVNEIATLLSEEGLDIRVVTGTPNYPSGSIYEGYGPFKKSREGYGNVEVRRLPLIPRGSGSKLVLMLNYISYFISCFFYTLYLACFGKKYDAILVHHTSPIFIAISPIIYKWMRNPTMMLWDLDMWPDTLVAMNIVQSPQVVKVLEKLVSWIYRQYDHIFIGSKSFKQKAVQRVSSDKVNYFPNWAESVFTNNETIIPPVGKFTFPEGFNIMYAGNIGEAQDFGNVLETIKETCSKNRCINWLFVGDGRNREWLEHEIEKNNLSDKVLFYGSHPVEWMPYFFSQADLMMLSLKDMDIFSKTVPAKLQAYMASAKPVAAMISGEGADIIDRAGAGMVAPSGNPEQFTRVILKMSRMESSQLDEMGGSGKKYYLEYFDLMARKRELMSIINRN